MDNAIKKRCLYLCLFIVMGLSVLSARLIYLQSGDSKSAGDYAGKSYERTYPLLAKRGTIVDCNGEIIAKSTISKTMMVDKFHLKDVRTISRGIACMQLRQMPEWNTWDEKTRNSKIKMRNRKLLNLAKPKEWYVNTHLDYACSELARPLGMTKEELKALIAVNERPLDKAIVQDIAPDLAYRLKDLIAERRIKGFRFDEKMKRFYVSPLNLTHLLGYVGMTAASDIEKGKSGIERAYEEYLAGKHGYKKEMRDPSGEIMPAYQGSVHAPINGYNVQLTVDMGMQEIVDSELDAAIAEYDPELATIILMDPNTGDILAMASRPHYNLETRKNIVKYGYNFGVQGVYEPGSTFKTLAAAAAVNEGLKTIDSKIWCYNGYYREGKIWVRDDYPKGYLKLWEILQKSNNIGTYMMAKAVGYDRYMKYAKDCGFGAKTGLGIGSEEKGILRKNGNMMDFSRYSFGYALNVTPLQIANFYCTIANGGKLMTPRLVKRVENHRGETVMQFKPEMKRRVFKERTCAKIRIALERVVQKGGTATKADVEGYTEGGKTGTARSVVDGKYSLTKKTVSFAGMLPIDKPKFVCVVVIQNPQAKKDFKLGGGSVAAPVWKNVMKRVAAYRGLTPTEKIEPVAQQ